MEIGYLDHGSRSVNISSADQNSARILLPRKSQGAMLMTQEELLGFVVSLLQFKWNGGCGVWMRDESEDL